MRLCATISKEVPYNIACNALLISNWFLQFYSNYDVTIQRFVRHTWEALFATISKNNFKWCKLRLSRHYRATDGSENKRTLWAMWNLEQNVFCFRFCLFVCCCCFLTWTAPDSFQLKGKLISNKLASASSLSPTFGMWGRLTSPKASE